MDAGKGSLTAPPLKALIALLMRRAARSCRKDAQLLAGGCQPTRDQRSRAVTMIGLLSRSATTVARRMDVEPSTRRASARQRKWSLQRCARGLKSATGSPVRGSTTCVVLALCSLQVVSRGRAAEAERAKSDVFKRLFGRRGGALEPLAEPFGEREGERCGRHLRAAPPDRRESHSVLLRRLRSLPPPSGMTDELSNFG